MRPRPAPRAGFLPLETLRRLAPDLKRAFSKSAEPVDYSNHRLPSPAGAAGHQAAHGSRLQSLAEGQGAVPIATVHGKALATDSVACGGYAGEVTTTMPRAWLPARQGPPSEWQLSSGEPALIGFLDHTCRAFGAAGHCAMMRASFGCRSGSKRRNRPDPVRAARHMLDPVEAADDNTLVAGDEIMVRVRPGLASFEAEGRLVLHLLTVAKKKPQPEPGQSHPSSRDQLSPIPDKR
jgi:hypothetical protein